MILAAYTPDNRHVVVRASYYYPADLLLHSLYYSLSQLHAAKIKLSTLHVSF